MFWGLFTFIRHQFPPPWLGTGDSDFDSPHAPCQKTDYTPILGNGHQSITRDLYIYICKFRCIYTPIMRISILGWRTINHKLFFDHGTCRLQCVYIYIYTYIVLLDFHLIVLIFIFVVIWVYIGFMIRSKSWIYFNH